MSVKERTLRAVMASWGRLGLLCQLQRELWQVTTLLRDAGAGLPELARMLPEEREALGMVLACSTRLRVALVQARPLLEQVRQRDQQVLRLHPEAPAAVLLREGA
jgi:hypothetical protein